MAPKIVDREEKRRTLLAAAGQVFSARGFHETRMAEIAVAAGVGKGTIYEYFEKKEDLLAGLFDLFWEGFEARAAALSQPDADAAGHPGGRERLIQHFVESVEASEELAEMIPIYFEFFGARYTRPDDPYRRKMEELIASLTRSYAAAIRRLQKNGEISADLDPNAFSRMLFASLDGIVLHFGFFRPNAASFRKQKRELRRMLETALRPNS